jgi:hypothetical protein
MLDLEESLTPEEIQLRFRKAFGRDMTPEEKHYFFQPTESDHEKTSGQSHQHQDH